MDQVTDQELEDLIGKTELKAVWEKRLADLRTALAGLYAQRTEAAEMPEDAPFTVKDARVTKPEFLASLDQQLAEGVAALKRIQARIGKAS